MAGWAGVVFERVDRVRMAVAPSSSARDCCKGDVREGGERRRQD